MSHATTTPRRIRDIRASHPSQDGDGVKILRLHDFEGGLDPFLMLDELGSDQPDDYIRGFPPHPHRGMQTLTYVIHGGLTHEDHLGHSSTIHAGDAQWMHTGRGMIHSEMPLTDAQGLHAFQLWINLPARDKLSPATYRDIRAQEMPRLDADGATLIALGGHWQDASAEIDGPLDALAGNAGVADARFEGGTLQLMGLTDDTLLVYVYRGTLDVGEQPVTAGHLAILDAGDALTLSATGSAGALLLRGTPHREPIAHYGPFVMNSRHELEAAMQAYRDGTLTE
ncbi:pirin family protein [Chromohalobacter israelensis]|uniref:pirin family protein n=1 Tax=Chromohalobacter israelensis TaxID=141390 RepID=UPI0015C425A5|nr:pirin family protein [Chromohalobacter salexigens]NWO55096.1 pirin family protein [Chromohalobacter salexigens]